MKTMDLFSTQLNQSDNEFHMLETDVMRFLAIITLCMAFIFAIFSNIVQEQKDLLQEKVQVSEEALISEDSQQKVQTPLENSPAAIQSPIADSPKQEPAIAPEQLAKMVKPEIEQEQTKPPPLESPVSSLAKQANSTENLTEKLAQPEPSQAITAKQPNLKTESPPIEAIPAKEEQEGLQLKFESEAVFTNLTESRKIQLFYINEHKVMQWAGYWRKSKTPPLYYTLEKSTVPNKFTPPGKSPGSFGVVLPQATQKQIVALLAKYSKGVLTIDSASQVQYTSSH